MRRKKNSLEESTPQQFEMPDFEDIRYSIVYAVLLGYDTIESVLNFLQRPVAVELLKQCKWNGWLEFDPDTGTFSVPMKGLVFLESYFDWEISTGRRIKPDYDPVLSAEYRKRFRNGAECPPLGSFDMTGRQELLDCMAKDRRVWLVFHEYPELFGFRRTEKNVSMESVSKLHASYDKALKDTAKKRAAKKKKQAKKSPTTKQL